MRFFVHNKQNTIAFSDNWNEGTNLTSESDIEPFFDYLLQEAGKLDKNIHDFELANVTISDSGEFYKVLLTEKDRWDGDVFMLKVPHVHNAQKNKKNEDAATISTETFFQLRSRTKLLLDLSFQDFFKIEQQIKKVIDNFNSVKKQAVYNIQPSEFKEWQEWFNTSSTVQLVVKKLKIKIYTMRSNILYKTQQLNENLELRLNNITHELNKPHSQNKEKGIKAYDEFFKEEYADVDKIVALCNRKLEYLNRLIPAFGRYVEQSRRVFKTGVAVTASPQEKDLSQKESTCKLR